MKLEDLFTGEEIDSALSKILSDDYGKPLYEGAPTDALRKDYLLETCFCSAGYERLKPVMQDISVLRKEL